MNSAVVTPSSWLRRQPCLRHPKSAFRKTPDKGDVSPGDAGNHKKKCRECFCSLGYHFVTGKISSAIRVYSGTFAGGRSSACPQVFCFINRDSYHFLTHVYLGMSLPFWDLSFTCKEGSGQKRGVE